MKNSQFIYTSGEFAKLAGINKRTLHYYNDTKLLVPEYVGENGYHYYSVSQIADLEFILALRRMGMSIKEIKAYVGHQSSESFEALLQEKLQLIEESIAQLSEMKAYLTHKATLLDLSRQAQHGKIELVEQSQRKIVTSASIRNLSEEEEFATVAAFFKRLKALFGSYDSFGCCLTMDAIAAKDFQAYENYFVYAPQDADTYDEIAPAGTYLHAYCVGDWDQLPAVYEQILAYAEKNHLRLVGSAYEEGLNEMSLQSMDEYITLISIRCERA